MNREEMLARLSEKTNWDIVVVGGGATGLGTALDAVSRGYRTALVEAVDFSKGTSSRSTKLIHGGVRYLRSGQLRMVHESLRERGNLMRNAPHIVHQRQFVIPAFQPGARWYYYAGMRAYDLLAGRLAFEPARLLSAEQTRKYLPTLKSDRLRGGASFFDGQFDDSRLAIALARTIADRGGVIANYAKAIRLLHANGRTTGVVVLDCESGNEFELPCKAVVNATGVFGQQVMQLDVQSPDTQLPRIVPSQGTHLVLPRRFLPTEAALLIPDTDDGRVLFLIPWHGKTLLGTTDRPVQEISLEPRPLDSEIDYLLAHASRYLTTPPQRCDVLSVFAGLRPLVGKERSDRPQSQTEGSTARLSREHEIHTSPSGLITVIGGKWTTYRQMGQDVVDLAARVAGLGARPSTTLHLQLAGAMGFRPGTNPEDPLTAFSGDVDPIDRLIQEDEQLGEPLQPRLPYLRAHVVWSARREMARTVDDVLARRTRSLLLDAEAAHAAAPQVAELLAAELGRDTAWQTEQIAEFRRIASGYVLAPGQSA